MYENLKSKKYLNHLWLLDVTIQYTFGCFYRKRKNYPAFNLGYLFQ